VEVHCSAAKTIFSNILHISMVSAAQTISSNGATSALFKNRIERRETMHFSHSIYVVSEFKKISFGLFLQIEIQTKKRLNQDGGGRRLDLPGWTR